MVPPRDARCYTRGVTRSDARTVAAMFAEALDRDDFDAARELLADDCEYDTGDGIVRGAGAVLAPYRETSQKARRTFDEIVYESEVERVDGARATILFTDRLRHAGRRHAFRCHQVIEVDGRGLVTRIEHREIDGEREKLEAFFRAAGVDW